MITLKSFAPDSIIKNFSIDHQTTASVGPVYRIVPFDSILMNVAHGIAIAVTSDKSFTIRNLSNSQTYLNSATISVNTACAVGRCHLVGMSSSDAGLGSGTFGRPFVSAGSLLKIDWSASKGDSAFAINFKRISSKLS
jgi:hypothetical protein